MPVQRTCSPARSTSSGPIVITAAQLAQINQIISDLAAKVKEYEQRVSRLEVRAYAQSGCEAVSA